MGFKQLKIFILFCAIIPFSIGDVYAQHKYGAEVDIKIYFPYDEYNIDLTYMDNQYYLNFADSLLRDSAYLSTLGSIEVTAQSSPEGRVSYNERLSKKRIQVLEKYFAENYSHLDSTQITFKSQAENWDLFNYYLAQDTNIPSYDKVLEISNGDKRPDDKERLLKKLDEGESWHYIKEHILPLQRFGAKVLFIPMMYPLLAKEMDVNTDYLMPSYDMFHPIDCDFELISETQKIILALKTNLVLDAVSIINIAAEIPIGKRFSIAAEIVYPWWRTWDKNFTVQIESYHAEFKYWLGDRDSKERLEGWSLGLYGGWGRYDIQPFSVNGVQGSLFDVGAQIGYSHAIAKNLNIEYTLGFGFISTSYEDYKMVTETQDYGDIKVVSYAWMQNSLKSFLPTRCGVSLIWVIKNRKGGKL